MTDIFAGVTFENFITTFFMSMVPVIELRGAIPVGVATGMSHVAAMIICIIGNLLPVPFIILFIRRIFDWMKRKSPKLNRLVERLEARAESKKEYIRKWEIFGLLLFVAIPLPGTGAWTGALIAGLMDLRLKSAFPAIVAGVVIAGLLVTGITFGFTSIF